jgi:hypothetical protein
MPRLLAAGCAAAVSLCDIARESTDPEPSMGMSIGTPAARAPRR